MITVKSLMYYISKLSHQDQLTIFKGVEFFDKLSAEICLIIMWGINTRLDDYHGSS